MVKEEFTDIELHGGGGLNLMFIRDTQPSRKVDIYGYRGIFSLTFGFKDVQEENPVYFNRRPGSRIVLPRLYPGSG